MAPATPTRCPLAAAALVLLLASCAPSAGEFRAADAVDLPTPASLDLEALEARTAPRPGRNGLLLHFWATW